MSRSIRQEIPESDCMVDRARARMKAAGIPELHCRRTVEDWEKAKQILKEEEILYEAKREARQKGWPSTKEGLLDAVKTFIGRCDGLVEPTHVTLPPALVTIVNSWQTADGGECTDGCVFMGMTVVLGDEFKLEDRC
jgi:hypothetical protein